MQASRVCPNSGGLIFAPTADELQANQADIHARLGTLEQEMASLAALVGRVVTLLESKVQ